MNPDNARIPRITAAAGTELADACSPGTLGRVSVPVWGTFLSEPLGIVALVGRYPAILLMPREPIPVRVAAFNPGRCRPGSYGVLVAVSSGYPPDRGRLLTCYAPLRRSPP